MGMPYRSTLGLKFQTSTTSLRGEGTYIIEKRLFQKVNMGHQEGFLSSIYSDNLAEIILQLSTPLRTIADHRIIGCNMVGIRSKTHYAGERSHARRHGGHLWLLECRLGGCGWERRIEAVK